MQLVEIKIDNFETIVTVFPGFETCAPAKRQKPLKIANPLRDTN